MKIFTILLMGSLVSVQAMQQKDPQVCNKKLIEAIRTSNFAHVQWWLSNGAQIDYISPTKRRTLLHLAAQFASKEICAYLIAKKANLNSVDYRGNTPLMLAVKRKTSQVHTTFLQAGADIDAVNQKGESALKIASSYFNQDAIEEIIPCMVNRQEEKILSDLILDTKNKIKKSLGEDSNNPEEYFLRANNIDEMYGTLIGKLAIEKFNALTQKSESHQEPSDL